MTHCRSEKDAPSSFWMSGSATLMIVMSTSSMNVPRLTATRVHHRFGSGWGALEEAGAAVGSVGGDGASAGAGGDELPHLICPQFGNRCKKCSVRRRLLSGHLGISPICGVRWTEL